MLQSHVTGKWQSSLVGRRGLMARASGFLVGRLLECRRAMSLGQGLGESPSVGVPDAGAVHIRTVATHARCFHTQHCVQLDEAQRSKKGRVLYATGRERDQHCGRRLGAQAREVGLR